MQRLEEDFQAQVEREIEMEKAKLLMSEDTHLSNEVQRIKNTIDQTLHDGNGKMMNNYVNFRPAVDGLMHHARTEVGSTSFLYWSTLFLSHTQDKHIATVRKEFQKKEKNRKKGNSEITHTDDPLSIISHSQTCMQMLNKVDAIKERSRIRRLNTQEYSEEMSQQIAKMKQQLREKPFKALSRPSTASSRPSSAYNSR